MPQLTGRRVLVTGASSGIGLATARSVSAAGGRVGLLARRADHLDRIAGEVDGVAVPADVTDVDAVRAAVQDAAEALGGLDGVVNAAGLALPSLIADADPTDWRVMVDVNVLGLLHVTQAVIPHLRRAGRGDIVNLSSMSGRRIATTDTAVYAATKHAVHAVSEGLRRELHDDGIRVSILAPGFVATPIFEDVPGAAAAALHHRATNQGLDPSAVADAIVRVLEAPPDVAHVEIALLSLAQTP